MEEMEAMLSELDGTLADPPQVGELMEQESSSQKVTQRIIQETDDQIEEDDRDEFEDYVIEKAQAITNLVLTNCAEDREEATAAIQMIKDLIQSQDKVVHGGTLQRLLQAIDTRSSISQTVVKVLESQAKILSARKGPSKNITNNSTNTAVGSAGLVAMLENGMKSKGQ